MKSKLFLIFIALALSLTGAPIVLAQISDGQDTIDIDRYVYQTTPEEHEKQGPSGLDEILPPEHQWYYNSDNWFNVVSIVSYEEDSKNDLVPIYDEEYTQIGSYSRKARDRGMFKYVPRYIPRIKQFLKGFILHQFDKSGTAPKGSKRYKALKKSDRIHDDRSTYLFITAFSDLNDIKAILRVARRGTKPENQLLPLEAYLGIRLPESEIKLGKTEWGHPVAFGGAVELKNFTHTKNPERDYIPILFERLISLKDFDKGHKLVEINGQAYPVVPTMFYLHCDESMQKYYSELGFTVYKKFPEHNSLVMQIDRDGLMKMFTTKKVQSRPGVQVVQRSHNLGPVPRWAPDPVRPFDCEDLLQDPPYTNMFFNNYENWKAAVTDRDYRRRSLKRK